MMPQVVITTRRQPHQMPDQVTVNQQHLNINVTIVGKEPVVEGMDSVKEWVNSVWREFLGYGAAVSALIMLIFGMAWCFRRTAQTNEHTTGQEQIRVIYHQRSPGSEPTQTSTAQSKSDTQPAVPITPPACPTPMGQQSGHMDDKPPMDKDTIAHLLAKCAY